MRRAILSTMAAGVMIIGVLPAVHAAAAPAAKTKLVSVATSGALANAYSTDPALSRNGRFTAFASGASNLVDGDTNGVEDIFVRDGVAGTTQRVSLATDGTQADRDSFAPSISRNGRYVGWTSAATTLVPDDTNNANDVFMHDLQTGITTRISVAADGTQGRFASLNPSFSANGRYVAFESAANNFIPGVAGYQVYRKDLKKNTFALVSANPDGTGGEFPGSNAPSISADGRYVAFESGSTQLVDGDGNGQTDVFRRDLQAGTTTLVSVPAGGGVSDGTSYHAKLSDDGRYIAFLSTATTMVPDDWNGNTDVFVRDLQDGTTTLAGVGADGAVTSQGGDYESISADGRFIAFESRADLTDGSIYQGYGQVFVKDRSTGEVTLASGSPTGSLGNSQSGHGAVSADGRSVAFYSYSSNLVSGDTNGQPDVFAQRRPAPTE